MSRSLNLLGQQLPRCQRSAFEQRLPTCHFRIVAMILDCDQESPRDVDEPRRHAPSRSETESRTLRLAPFTGTAMAVEVS